MGPYSEKKKDCVSEGPCAGDMISPMGHDSKKKNRPADAVPLKAEAGLRS